MRRSSPNAASSTTFASIGTGVLRRKRVRLYLAAGLIRRKQRVEVYKRCFNVLTGGIVVALDHDKRFGRRRAGGALGALTPAPASGTYYACFVNEDDFAGVGVNRFVRPEVGEEFVAISETDGNRTRDA